MNLGTPGKLPETGRKDVVLVVSEGMNRMKRMKREAQEDEEDEDREAQEDEEDEEDEDREAQEDEEDEDREAQEDEEDKNQDKEMKYRRCLPQRSSRSKGKGTACIALSRRL